MDMATNIKDIIGSWQKPVNPVYYHHNPGFSLKPFDYRIRGITESESHGLPNGVPFNPNYTNFGLVLQAPRKGKTIDVAVAGFNADNGVADCLQIQAGKGRLREITPLEWYGAQLESLIELAEIAELYAVQVIPHTLIEISSTLSAGQIERINIKNESIYDRNAISHNFRYSENAKRFILELRANGSRSYQSHHPHQS